jgi:hypothetical protein
LFGTFREFDFPPARGIIAARAGPVIIQLIPILTVVALALRSAVFATLTLLGLLIIDLTKAHFS